MENKPTVLLNTQADWEEWIELLKTAALVANVWTLIDPTRARTTLIKPVRPSPNDIKPSSTRYPTPFSALNPEEAEEYRDQKREYQRQLDRYDRCTHALAAIRARIQETINRDFLPYTFNCDTPYEMLV